MQRLIQHLAHLALILLACNVDSALCWPLDRNATLGDGNSLSLTARTSQLAQDPGKPLSDQNSKDDDSGQQNHVQQQPCSSFFVPRAGHSTDKGSQYWNASATQAAVHMEQLFRRLFNEHLCEVTNTNAPSSTHPPTANSPHMAVDAQSQFKIRTNSKSTRCGHQILQELTHPSQKYTVLLPEPSKLLELDEMFENLADMGCNTAHSTGSGDPHGEEACSEEISALAKSLLLHVIPGSHTMQELAALAIARKTVRTLSGKKLEILTTTQGAAVAFKHQDIPTFFASDLNSQTHESCQRGTTLIWVSDTLTYHGLRRNKEFQTPLNPKSLGFDSLNCSYQQEKFYSYKSESCMRSGGHSDDTIGNIDNIVGSYFWESDEDIPKIMLYAPGLLLIGAFMYIQFMKVGTVRVRRLQPAGNAAFNASNNSTNNSSSNSGLVPQPAPISVPKVLYKIDTGRWSVLPPASLTHHHTLRTLQTTNNNQNNGDCESLSIIQIRPQGEHGASLLHSVATRQDPENPDNMCLICYEKEPDHVLLPCGHSGFCGACAHTLLRPEFKFNFKSSSCICPICRAPINVIARVPVDTAIGAEASVLEPSVRNRRLGGLGIHAWESDEALIRAFQEDSERRVADTRAAASAACSFVTALLVLDGYAAMAAARAAVRYMRSALR